MRDTHLAGRFNKVLDEVVSSQQTWEVSLESGRLQWDDGQTTWHRDPDASLSRRFMAGLMRILPIEFQL